MINHYNGEVAPTIRTRTCHVLITINRHDTTYAFEQRKVIAGHVDMSHGDWQEILDAAKLSIALDASTNGLYKGSVIESAMACWGDRMKYVR